MRALFLGGQREAALAQYDTFRRILNWELGLQPGVETMDLYHQMKYQGVLLMEFRIVYNILEGG